MRSLLPQRGTLQTLIDLRLATYNLTVSFVDRSSFLCPRYRSPNRSIHTYPSPLLRLCRM